MYPGRPPSERPCWYCTAWAGLTPVGVGICNHPKTPRSQASPESGCAFFEREPGVDDDAWAPVQFQLAAMGPRAERDTSHPVPAWLKIRPTP